jgi:hypothetical protein
MRKIRLILALAGVGLGVVPLSSPAPAFAGMEEGNCRGRYSWLVPNVCTYCEWGGACGGCSVCT